jgi:hypothetical protein
VEITVAVELKAKVVLVAQMVARPFRAHWVQVVEAL